MRARKAFVSVAGEGHRIRSSLILDPDELVDDVFGHLAIGLKPVLRSKSQLHIEV
jgi:hypothetical protein